MTQVGEPGAVIHRNVFRAAAGALVAAAVVHVVTVWPRVAQIAEVLGSRSWLVVAGFVVSGLTALAACALAVLLLWKAPDRPDARALTLFLGFLAIFWGSLFRFLEVEMVGGELSVNLSYGGGWVSDTALASFVLAAASFLRFSILFPRRLTEERLPTMRSAWGPGRLRRLFLSPVAVWGTALFVLLVHRFLPRLTVAFVGLPTEEGALPPGLMASLLVGISLIVVFALFAVVLGARNLRDSYRTAGPEERDRILWVVAGFTVATWMVVGAIGLMLLIAIASLDITALGAAIPLALVLAPLVLVIGAAVGILYSGAIDPGLALKRSTIYGALGAVGVVGFAVIESAVSEAVEGWLDLPGFVGSMAAGVMVTLALLGIRRVVTARAPGPGLQDPDGTSTG